MSRFSRRSLISWGALVATIEITMCQKIGINAIYGLCETFKRCITTQKELNTTLQAK